MLTSRHNMTFALLNSKQLWLLVFVQDYWALKLGSVILMSHLEMDILQSHSLHTGQLWVFVLIVICCIKKKVSHSCHLRKGGTKAVRARGSGWPQQNIIFQTQQGSSAYESVSGRFHKTWTRSSQKKNPSKEGERGLEIPPLTKEELLTTDGSWRESQLSSGLWPLRGYPCSNTRPHSHAACIYLLAALSGLCGFTKVKKMWNWKEIAMVGNTEGI